MNHGTISWHELAQELSRQVLAVLHVSVSNNNLCIMVYFEDHIVIRV